MVSLLGLHVLLDVQPRDIKRERKRMGLPNHRKTLVFCAAAMIQLKATTKQLLNLSGFRREIGTVDFKSAIAKHTKCPGRFVKLQCVQ